MLVNFIVLIVLVAIAGVCLRFIFRVWKSKKAVVKWGGVVGLALPVFVFSVLSIVLALGMFKSYMPRGNEVVEYNI
ncbi:MAG: hypothetical protein FJ319_14215 [SAR202 cluster bacterium]|nr:hypothetical protein [SAR202 cluster bacterium]